MDYLPLTQWRGMKLENRPAHINELLKSGKRLGDICYHYGQDKKQIFIKFRQLGFVFDQDLKLFVKEAAAPENQFKKESPSISEAPFSDFAVRNKPGNEAGFEEVMASIQMAAENMGRVAGAIERLLGQPSPPQTAKQSDTGPKEGILYSSDSKVVSRPMMLYSDLLDVLDDTCRAHLEKLSSQVRCDGKKLKKYDLVSTIIHLGILALEETTG